MQTLVMIPALGCTEALYGLVAKQLGAAVDLMTIVPDADRFVGCVAQVLDRAPENFIILGTSFGGRVAIETTLAAPSRVKGMVVIGASPGPVADAAAGLRRTTRIRSGEFEQVLSEMGDMISHLPGDRGPATRDAFKSMSRETGIDVMARQSDALAHRQDLWPRMPEISCPTLCLWGREDKFSPASEGLRLSQTVQHGSYVEIADCGHFPTLECPEETATVINHWLMDFGAA